MNGKARRCPGCGLEMPPGEAGYDGYYHTSPECWSLYTEVLGAEFGNAVLFGQVHMLTVDSYACQHAGGPHPDKSVDVHLVGLHLVLERGLPPTQVPPRLQELARVVESWPHWQPPAERGGLTVFDVAAADSPAQHAATVRAWAAQVWDYWRLHHRAIADLASRCRPARG